MKKSLQADKTLAEGSSASVFATKLAQRCNALIVSKLAKRCRNRSSGIKVKKSLQADAFQGACAELTRAMARVDFDTSLIPKERYWPKVVWTMSLRRSSAAMQEHIFALRRLLLFLLGFFI